MGDTAVLRRCGGRQCPPGTCDHDGQLRRHAAGPGPGTAPATVHSVLGSAGQPLDAATRAHLEPRLGHDFSQVRVHTDAPAAASANAVGARAWTVGTHLAFAAGTYQPGTAEGRRLIAHELAHVVQQAGTPAAPATALAVGAADHPAEREAEAAAGAVARGDPVPPMAGTAPALRRACPPAPTNIAAAPLQPFPCGTAGPDPVAGDVVGFCRDSTEILDGQTGWLDTVVAEAKASPTVEIHGNASPEGPSAQYNMTLSCMRAAAFRDFLAARGVSTPITLVAHGPTTAYGPAAANRNVVVRMNPNTCGPEATDWVIRQVATAKRDPDVLGVRDDLAAAHRELGALGYSSQQIAEGAVLTKVLEREKDKGNPPRTATASAQIAAATPGLADLSAAKRDAVVSGIGGIVGGSSTAMRAALLVDGLQRIRRAGLTWAGLVGPRKRYDFKNDTGTMKGPSTPTCPKGCANTITLTSVTGPDCYVTDVPGNLFYAHVGRWVGWSELALQLGSEFAQLENKKIRWDPPEDTALIAAAYALPDPLTAGALAAMLAANRGNFDLKPCLPCTELTTAVIR